MNDSASAGTTAGTPVDAHAPKGSTPLLTLGAIGVVFGDIGTSPLYALKESFVGHHPMPVSDERIFGVISIVFWIFLLIVTLKYVVIMLRADNKGEGGSLALLALLSRRSDHRWTVGLTMLGVCATALFFGDVIITPAISVLSAVEGVGTVNEGLLPLAMPMAMVIIFALFWVQKYGTARVGAFFGPIVLVYFIVLTVLGFVSLIQTPAILGALNPYWAIIFIAHDPVFAFFALGSIVLAITGAEALYADLGHYGKKPIRLAWLLVVFPALMTNYLGQGALLLRDPAAVQNPFYLLVPEALRVPMILLAVAATVIASQAVITGAFSVVRQAVQLGLFPRVRILHTSSEAEGQVYVPLINWVLCFLVLVLVLLFGTSSSLASAYGIAVTGTMFITTLLFAVLVFRHWKWPLWLSVPLVGLFLVIDLTFFASNLTKFVDGGWFPILVAAAAFIMLTTWAAGRRLMHARLASGNMPVGVFVKSIGNGVHRVRGTGIYLTSSADGIPPSLLHNLKHNQVLHERILLTTVEVRDVPFVDPANRVVTEALGGGMTRVIIRYGFSEDPDIPAALAEAKDVIGLCDMMTTTYFLSRQTIIPSEHPGMALWRERLFGWMIRNAATPMEFFKLPPNRVVELGSQVTI